MSVKWHVDQQLNKLMWSRLNKAPYVLLKNKNIEKVLDLGGGSGWFANKVKEKKSSIEVHSIDIVPNDMNNGVVHHKGSILDMPFPDGHFQGATAHAVLHHVPDNLKEAIAEAHRVLGEGAYFVIEEPGGNNFFANLARKLFPTEKHDPDERPLPVKQMVDAVGEKFEVKQVEHFFIFSYLFPHLVPRMPWILEDVARWKGKILFRLDQYLLEKMPWTRRYAGYILIIAKKSQR